MEIRNYRTGYLSNGHVAWEIPPGRIAFFYQTRAYLPPPGWEVVNKFDVRDYRQGECGELRRELVNA